MSEFSIVPKEPKHKQLHDNLLIWLENYYANSEEPAIFEHMCTRSYRIQDRQFFFIFSIEFNGTDRICDVIGQYDAFTNEVIGIPTIVINDNIFENN